MPKGMLRVRGTTFAWGTRTYVMGIVNVSPDSFSGDGILDVEVAVERARLHAAHGADILDIGGQSTRPGYETISPKREIGRIVPVIQGVRHVLPHVPISVDTYKPQVAMAAADAGADIINCVWLAPDDMLAVARDRGMPFIAMHNQREAQYRGHVVDEVVASLEAAAQRARDYGLAPEAIVLDPGIGFGKTAEANLEVLSGLRTLCALPYPTLLGTSRKSTIGALTGRAPHERAWGTAATTALAIAAGIDIVRVHDVAETRDVVAVSDAIERGWRPPQWTA